MNLKSTLKNTQKVKIRLYIHLLAHCDPCGEKLISHWYNIVLF